PRQPAAPPRRRYPLASSTTAASPVRARAQPASARHALRRRARAPVRYPTPRALPRFRVRHGERCPSSAPYRLGGETGKQRRDPRRGEARTPSPDQRRSWHAKAERERVTGDNELDFVYRSRVKRALG